MTRRGVALGAVSLFVAHTAAAEPVCSTRVLVDPDTAFVGQQITYRLQIFRRSDVSSVRFARDLSFPSFRAEWLPGQSPDPAITEIGDHALVFEERRALFPARAGELTIPAARIECVGATQTTLADVPAARVLVRELPPAGRAPGFRGVVGKIDVQAHLSNERVVLGESLTLAITVRGVANAWDAADPLDPARDLAGVDVYTHPPTTERETGSHLEVRRAFSFDLVPRSVGTFEIPALRVPYFDLEHERYEAAETRVLRFTVEPAASDAARPIAPAATASRRSAISRGNFGAAVLFALVAASLFGVSIARLRRRAQQQAARRAAEPLLADAAAASARGDQGAAARALAAALRAAIETRVPGAGALAAEEIAARDEASLRAVGEALVDLDRLRFGAAPGQSRSLDAEQVRALIASL